MSATETIVTCDRCKAEVPDTAGADIGGDLFWCDPCIRVAAPSEYPPSPDRCVRCAGVWDLDYIVHGVCPECRAKGSEAGS